jgi:hypothetical protein
MKQISEIIKDEEIKRCSCGSAAFFDWGLQLLNSAEQYLGPRYNGYTGSDGIRVCANCRKPVLLKGGDLYDCSEYISPEQIHRLISWSQDKPVSVPTHGMDP